MKVTIEGLITSVKEETKDSKKFTNLLIMQRGERVQVQARLEGHVGDNFEEMEKIELKGRLQAWAQRDGIGMMVMADAAQMV
ncbi:hypothetical protein NST74_29880 [Paenibacillus sp. FSL F4-0125]|uniref:hypothetical protein n=1 Tax=Paenibacillus sp. FSL F4-0125 TaxID=2954730 RepID=UPI0030F9EAAC